MKTENNKIIAEFMGWKIQKDPTERFFGRYKSPIGAWYKEIDLAFHHDWNWLMEVVEKIESLGYSIIINENWCVIKSKRTLYKKERIANTKIEAVYNACIEFIKWYNNQNSAKKTEITIP